MSRKVSLLAEARFDSVMNTGRPAGKPSSRQVRDTVARIEVVDEATHPGHLTGRIGPDLDVPVHALEGRTAQFERAIETMERVGELEIECSIVLRKHVLPVGLLAHLDVGDRIVPFLEV